MQFKILFKPRAAAGKKSEILIACYFARKYKYIGTGCYIEPPMWDDAKSLVIAKHPQAATINKICRDKIHELETACYKYEAAGSVFDFTQLANLTKGKDKQSFCNFIADEIRREELEPLSVQKYNYNNSILRLIIGDKPLQYITEKDITDIDLNLHTQFADSTVARLHIFIQKYIKQAIKQRLIAANPYDLVRLQKFRAEPKNTFHTIEELEALEAIPLKFPDTICMIRDRYLFSCYTGLRISDNLALLKTNLIDTPDGYIVDLHTIKGYGHDLIHPIGLMFDGKPDQIARRWMVAHNEPTLFPTVSREYVRTVLTMLAELAEIKKHMTFHVARHTCACLLADISQNPYLIMNVLGHRDIKTSMSYIHRSPETIKKQFRLLTDWKEKAR